MAHAKEVTCIDKPDRFNPHERIREIGGWDGSLPWHYTEDQAIAYIEAGTYTFFTLARGTYADVVIREHPTLSLLGVGRKYLTTHPDQTKENNLLYLDDCKIQQKR